AAFSLGGPPWIVAPALALAAFTVLDPATRPARGEVPIGRYQVLAVFYLSIVAVALIFADNTFKTLVHGAPRGLTGGHACCVPYVATLAAQVAIIALLFLKTLRRARRWGAVAVALAAAGIGFVWVAPIGVWAALRRVPLEAVVIGAGVCCVATALYLAGR